MTGHHRASQPPELGPSPGPCGWICSAPHRRSRDWDRGQCLCQPGTVGTVSHQEPQGSLASGHCPELTCLPTHHPGDHTHTQGAASKGPELVSSWLPPAENPPHPPLA